MYYALMRKNIELALVEIEQDGRFIWAQANEGIEPLLPLQNKTDYNGLQKWWETRSVPLQQGKVAEMLKDKGIIGPEEYLTKNLGLSLTDYYWIKPFNSDLSWEDVNLYDNEFQNEMNISENTSDSRVYGNYTPNGSLQGALEKKWGIINGERYLIKGNSNNYSTESINEVFASLLHQMQGTFEYTPYQLFKIKDRDYDYGCISKQFTSQQLELVSAYAIVTSEAQRNDVSSYEHFINVCGKYGIDTEELRRSLEYQIQTDFILSNRDRHLNNVGILRDANSLNFIKMAPIFDTGKCLFVRKDIPLDTRELLSVDTVSFAANELKLMKYITERDLIDVSKLPGKEALENLYLKDSQMPEKRIKLICDTYEKKIELYREFQLDQDLNKIKISFKRPGINFSEPITKRFEEARKEAGKGKEKAIANEASQEKQKDNNKTI